MNKELEGYVWVCCGHSGNTQNYMSSPSKFEWTFLLTLVICSDLKQSRLANVKWTIFIVFKTADYKVRNRIIYKKNFLPSMNIVHI